jgi:FAD/FMN-containing dehydrogenase
MPMDTAVAELEGALRGPLIRPGDPDYDEARKVYNGMIDRRPALVVRPVDVADVSAAVNFARDQGLPLAVRGGGHNPNGFGTCDDGLVIDMSLMKGPRVDEKGRRVRAGGGCTWGDVDHATHAYGLATPGGIISTTGIAGLTLGGGVGHLTRKYGLSCDNLVSADVVLADGSVVTASEKDNKDLLWALRGGGGNFGVVTSFEFRLHEVDNVFAGPIFYPLEKGADVLRFYREFMDGAPDELNAFFAYLIVPPAPPFPEPLHNQTVAAVACCYCGPIDKGDQATRPLREFGPPVFEHVGPMPFPALNSAFDPLVPPGLQHYWKADFFNSLSDEVVAGHVKYGPQIPTFQSAMHVYPTDGAAGRVGKNDTAFSYREAKYNTVIAAMYPDPADTEKNVAWVRQYWDALHPHSSGGAYVNFMMDEGDERIAASYRDNYKRLAEIKAKYDPGNLFRLNQNIKTGVPAAAR